MESKTETVDYKGHDITLMYRPSDEPATIAWKASIGEAMYGTWFIIGGDYTFDDLKQGILPIARKQIRDIALAQAVNGAA